VPLHRAVTVFLRYIFAAHKSVKAHYLNSYRNAIAAVLRAQFSPSKGCVGGRAGALALAENPYVSEFLSSAGLPSSSFRLLAPTGTCQLRLLISVICVS
jgi:hypothetical protein